MDFHDAIIEFLGIQHVKIEEIKFSKKPMQVRITARQDRSECFCDKCGVQFDGVKDWQRKEIKAPPLGIYCKSSFFDVFNFPLI